MKCLNNSTPFFSILSSLMLISSVIGLEFNATRRDKDIEIDVLIGKPPQNISFSIDSFNPYTWVNESSAILALKKSYESSRSKSIVIDHNIIKLVIPSINNEIYAKHSFEQITFDDSTISAIPLHLISDSLYQLSRSSGGLGLGRPVTIEQKKSSFIYLLSNNSEISYMVYSIEYELNKIRLLFGKIDKEIVDNHCHFALFNNTLVDSTQFGFILNEIYANNNKDNMYSIANGEVIIDYVSKYSYVPISFMVYLEKNIFNDLITTERCSFYLFDNSNEYSFICTEIKELEDQVIMIQVNNWKLSLKIDKLFNIDSSIRPEYIFGLRSKNDESRWLFGESILNQFITVFDLEVNQIGLYSRDNKVIAYTGNDINSIAQTKIPSKSISQQQRMIIKISFGILFICISIGIIVIAYRFIRRKKLMLAENDYYNIEH